ncbi:MAG: DNA-directed RNA polymerase subunit omega [Phycisphaerales bacterium]|nr:DNA-directed RNA polymerase subunit omega [Phycisphaerales bacterium]
MIETLNNDDIINKVGGRFRLTALIQKRWLELLQGSRPMIEAGGRSELEIVVEEIRQGKIGIDYEASGIPAPESA